MIDRDELSRDLENSPHVARMAWEIVASLEGLSLVASPEGPPPWCFLHKLKRCKGGSGSRPRWKSDDGRILYEWDARHKNIEAYNNHGKHMGAFDTNGKKVEKAKKGRNINVH